MDQLGTELVQRVLASVRNLGVNRLDALLLVRSLGRGEGIVPLINCRP